MSNSIERKLLSYLYDRYENSVLSKQGSLLNLRIKTKITSVFSHYDESGYYQERLAIDEACQKLEKENMIWITYQKEDIDEVGLVLEEQTIKSGYHLIGRKYKQDFVKELVIFLNKVDCQKQWIIDFRDEMIEKMESYKSVKSYLSLEDLSETVDIFKVLNELETQEKEISYRKFSVKVLRDSKRFEAIKTKVINIVNDYFKIKFQDEDEMFGYFNIVKNPSFVYLNGNMTIKLNHQMIDLGKLNGPFSITTDNIKNLEIIDIKDHQVVTIENLTSFYDTKVNDTLLIYLGGYHNQLRRDLLVKIYHFNHTLQFYHFGDIDAGGFYILQHLKNKTGIPFQPLFMDLDTLIKYEKYTKPTTKHDQKRLVELQGFVDENLIDYMLLNHCKLEQEIVDLPEDLFEVISS